MIEAHQELEGRVVEHLEELADQTDSFDRVSSQLGAKGFAAAWNRAGTAEQMDLKGSVERAYEQIVNDLHGMLELIRQRPTEPESSLIRASLLGPTPRAKRGERGGTRLSRLGSTRPDQLSLAPLGAGGVLPSTGISIMTLRHRSSHGATRVTCCSTRMRNEPPREDMRFGARCTHSAPVYPRSWRRFWRCRSASSKPADGVARSQVEYDDGLRT
jgi:hypothetical protein